MVYIHLICRQVDMSLSCSSCDLQVTHLFRDVLHGWGQIMLSVNVSPCAKDYDETSHVLKVLHYPSSALTHVTGQCILTHSLILCNATLRTMRSFFAQQDHLGVLNYVIDCPDFMNISHYCHDWHK